MTDTLSAQLNLKVNNYQIWLGKELDVTALGSHQISKAGFWARILLRPAKGELLFWAKNAGLAYFAGEDNTIVPVVDKDSEKKIVFGTTSYLWYRENKLFKFGFQVAQNQAVRATTLFEDIEKKITDAIGEPTSSGDNLKMWELKGQRLVLEIPLTARYGYLHLLYQD
jgi:hypothetical protein